MGEIIIIGDVFKSQFNTVFSNTILKWSHLHSNRFSNLFSPKPHGKWQWRHLIRGSFWKFKNQERYLFPSRTVHFRLNIWIIFRDPVPLRLTMVNFGTVAAVMHAWSLYIKAISRALETNPQKCVTFLRLPKVFPRQYGVVYIIAFIDLLCYRLCCTSEVF